MISVKYALIMAVGAFAAGSFFTSPIPAAIAAIVANDVQCTGCVGTSDLAFNAVTTAKIKDGEVKTADIGTGQVTNTDLATGAVNSAKIADETIAYGDVSRNLIAVEHRWDCNCGGTGWDPDGTDTIERIFDSRIKWTSVVSVTVHPQPGNVIMPCSTLGGMPGAVDVMCTAKISDGMAVNYAIFTNPAAG